MFSIHAFICFLHIMMVWFPSGPEVNTGWGFLITAKKLAEEVTDGSLVTHWWLSWVTSFFPLAFFHCPKHTKPLQEKIMEKQFLFRHCRRINSFQIFRIWYSSMIPIIKKCHNSFAFQQRINYFELCELIHKKPAFPWVGHGIIWNKINLIQRNTGIFKIN